MPKYRQHLQLQFKGSRDYLHGTDIYNETLSRICAETDSHVSDVDFSFHRPATRQLDLLLGEMPEGAEPAAVCVYSCGGKRSRAYLLETDKPVTGRYPYPEEEMMSDLDIDAPSRRCALEGQLPYSEIEIWVAMTKALHCHVFPDLVGKWMFARGRFASYEHRSKAADRSLAIKACFNNRLTRSEAFLSDEKIGEIYFSLV